MLYRKDLFEKSGLTVPTTIDEMLAAGKKLKADNASTPNFSGMYLPGKNWFAALPFIWVTGGDIAVQEGDAWKGMLSSDESVAGLTQFQQFIQETSGAPKDGDDSKDYIAFCNGEVGMMPAPGWKPGQIINPDDGCPDMEANIGAFAMPGLTAGTTSPAFLGGSNLAISANSENPELAYELLKILVSTDYQQQFADQGTIPALKSLLGGISGSEGADGSGQGRREQPLRAVQRELGSGRGEQHPARHDRGHLRWRRREGRGSEGRRSDRGDPQRLIPSPATRQPATQGEHHGPSRQLWKWKTRRSWNTSMESLPAVGVFDRCRTSCCCRRSLRSG